MWVNFSDYPVGDAPAVWSKIPALVDAFKRYPEAKWVWWLDFDALIMTPTIDLGSHLLNPEVMLSKLWRGQGFPLWHLNSGGDYVFHLPEDLDPNEIHLIISSDQNGINAGSIFLRRNTWTDIFLDLWSDPLLMSQDWWAYEQDAIVHLLRHHQCIRDHVGIVSQKLINAYPNGDIEWPQWQPNDLVIHFPACE